MQGQGEERQVQQFCPLSPDKDGVDKLIGSVRRLLVHERIQQRALLREDIANSLCDIAQASLLTQVAASVAATIASAKTRR
jgi:hypothetical protein